MKPVVTLYCIADEAGFRLLRGKGAEIEEVLHASAEAFDDVEHEFGARGRNRAGTGATGFGHDTRSAAEIGGMGCTTVSVNGAPGAFTVARQRGGRRPSSCSCAPCSGWRENTASPNGSARACSAVCG